MKGAASHIQIQLWDLEAGGLHQKKLQRESAGLKAVWLTALDLVAALAHRAAAYKDKSGSGPASVSAMPLTFLSCMQNSRLYLPA